MGRKDAASQGTSRAVTILMADVVTPLMWWAVVAIREVAGETNPHVYYVATGGLFGLMSCLLVRDRSRSRSLEPLYDAQINHPS